MRRFGHLITLVVTVAVLAGSSFAQEGKLKIKVTPKQAYVFVDGKAIRDGSQSIKLSAGKHTVAVVNYGYKISTQDVNIEAGKSTGLTVALEPYGDKVSGPWGRIQFKGHPRAAVLSNGTTPAYFVGHVDEFDNDFIWKQELLLPPGKHHLTVTQNDAQVWSGDVNVESGKKITIDLNKNGAEKTSDWSKREKALEKKAPLPRFKAGIASATVAVAPVKGTFSASNANINCGQNSTLNWQTSEAVDTTVDNGVSTNGQSSGTQSVSPHQTTTYNMNAAGPGGTATGSATVNVNTAVQASLAANPSDLKYRKIGDKVITQDSSTLTWQTSNADSVTLDPGGKVDPSGSQTVKAEPKDTSEVAEGGQPRPIDETQTYTLNATNVCGGTSTQTAALHVTGDVEPIPAVTLQSVFYPTDYPDKRHPQVGLVRSQQLALATLADGFKKYLEYDPDAKLSVEAYADRRGSKSFNQDLSERRVERIKQYLVDQGVSADKIQTAAYGKDRPMEKSAVKDLENTNPNKPPKARMRNVTGDWYAYNRRADIVLLPSGKKSAQFFPHNADDAGLIWQIPKPSLKKVEKDQ
ncbi:MAG TPA: OmpA family protein [Candidatus Binataceae bacterium]|nr:OmpA family protein [Candidatus Binataceae bacterium]